MEGFILLESDASIGIVLFALPDASVVEEENDGKDGNEFPKNPLPDASTGLPDASTGLPDASVEENNENDSNCDDDDENKSFILVVPFLFKNNDFIQYL